MISGSQKNYYNHYDVSTNYCDRNIKRFFGTTSSIGVIFEILTKQHPCANC